MTKGRLLTFWAALCVLAYIFASQDWYSLSMAPNGDTVKLASYDGLTAYGNLSPIIMLNFAAIIAVAFVGSIGRKITTALLFVANAGTAAWALFSVATQDVSGLAKQVEQMTGIAATHGVKDLTVQTLSAPYGFLGALAAMALICGLIFWAERKWPKRQARTERAAASVKNGEPKDAIGIWDSQRR